MCMMDKYTVLDMIGEGSFGRVFRGKDKQTGEVVALKLIPKVGHSEREIHSLRSECKIQKELNHPNIVRMIDAFETDNEVISVAEYVPGELFRLFDQYKVEAGERRLPEQRVKEIAGDLISALHYLHSHRILHRDIKPQNILLDSSGKAKLCDFGFARNLGLNTFVLTSIKGTPLYMAPELIEEKPYDHTADIWSLGCIIYELLTGQPPFSTTSLFQLIKKIRYESIQWPTHISHQAKSFLQGTLEKDSRRRLSWPDLPLHPFVCEHVHLVCDPGTQPLTRTLSASQELVKEIQRQDKAKLLPGGSQTLIRVAQKHEIQKQQLAALQKAHSFAPKRAMMSKPEQRRFSDGSHLSYGTGTGLLLGRHNPGHTARRMSEVGQQLSMLPSIAQAQYIAPAQPKNTATHPAPLQFTDSLQKGGLANIAKPAPIKKVEIVGQLEFVAQTKPGGGTEELKLKAEDKNTSIDSNETIKNEEMEEKNLNETSILIAEEKYLESDEWCEFLDSQLEEMLAEIDAGGNLDSVDNPNFLEIIIGPLKNKNANCLVLKKISSILTLPLATQDMESPIIKRLLDSFSTKKIVQLLIIALETLLTKPKEDMTQEENTISSITCLLVRLIHVKEQFAAELRNLATNSDKSILFQELLSKQDNIMIICDTLAILNKLFSLKTSFSSKQVIHLLHLIQEILTTDNVKVKIKSLTAVGLLARNYPESIDDATKILDIASQIKDNVEVDNINLKKAANFAMHVLKAIS